MRSLKMLIATVLVASPLAVTPVLAAGPGSGKDILATAAESGRFTQLLKAVEAAGLTDKLKGPGPFTIFAPSDDAFAKVAPHVMSELLDPANKDELAGILKAHVVPGRLLASDLKSGPAALGTLVESDINIDPSGGLRASNAKVVTTDVIASNGVIHIVDTVIEPAL